MTSATGPLGQKESAHLPYTNAVRRSGLTQRVCEQVGNDTESTSELSDEVQDDTGSLRACPERSQEGGGGKEERGS